MQFFKTRNGFLVIGAVLVVFILLAFFLSGGSDAELPGSEVDVEIEGCGVRLPDDIECRDQ